MSGQPLAMFTTLVESTEPAFAKNAETWVNEATLRNYTLARIQNGKSMTDYVQGGDKIQDRIFLNVTNTYRRYNPNVRITYDQSQPGTNWTVEWAFAYAYMAYTKQDLGLNKGMHSAEYMGRRLKDVLMQKYTDVYTDVCNSKDGEIWALPNRGLMEDTNTTGGAPRQPQSIPVAINEYDNALPLTSVEGGSQDAGSLTWTTVQQINLNNEANWRCQRQAYAYTAGAIATVATLATAMTRMWYATHWDRLPKMPQYSDKSTSPHVILCSLTGIANYEHMLQLGQDFFRGVGKQSGQDPAYDKPTFRNIPLDYIEALDTYAGYPTGAAGILGNEASTANDGGGTNSDGVTEGWAGPRYYFVNGEYMRWTVHSQYYFDREEIRPSDQPMSRAVVWDMWDNLTFQSLKRHGILYPSADTTNA